MTKSIFTCCFLCITICLNAQQSFCESNSNSDYLPLNIEKKVVKFGEFTYVESIIGKKNIGGKEYVEFEQRWDHGGAYKTYLRKQENQTLMHEDCCEEDTVRFSSAFKEGSSWLTADGITKYTIKSFNGQLETPHCLALRSL